LTEGKEVCRDNLKLQGILLSRRIYRGEKSSKGPVRQGNITWREGRFVTLSPSHSDVPEAVGRNVTGQERKKMKGEKLDLKTDRVKRLGLKGDLRLSGR